jgi:hypothetical protein
MHCADTTTSNGTPMGECGMERGGRYGRRGKHWNKLTAGF